MDSNKFSYNTHHTCSSIFVSVSFSTTTIPDECCTKTCLNPYFFLHHFLIILVICKKKREETHENELCGNYP